MIYSLSNLLIDFGGLMPYNVLLLSIILFLYFISKRSIKFDIGIRHKIHNFYLNYFFLYIYVLYYMALTIYLRYITWNQSVDLKPFWIKMKAQIYLNPLTSIIFALLIVILFIWLSKLRLYLLKEVRKRHIFQYNYYQYYYYKKYLTETVKIKEPINLNLAYTPIYNRICNDLKLTYSYYHFILYIIIFIEKILSKKAFTDKDTNLKLIPKWILFGFKIMPLIILLLLFCYDCFWQNFTITLVFYYLPFYFVYAIWYNITVFLRDTSSEMNRIIYERYYEEDNVLYYGLTEEEDKVFDTYLKNGLKCLSSYFKWTNKYLEHLETIIEWEQIVINQRRYCRDTREEFKNRFVYCNENIGILGHCFEYTKEQFEDLKNSKVD